MSGKYTLQKFSVVPKTPVYDINQKILIKIKKGLFPNFQFILFFRVKVMHWHCSIDYGVKLILGHENFC